MRGILNGVDYEEWDPRHDRYLPIHFGPQELAKKAELKRNFLLRQNLRPAQGRVPLFGIVSRLTPQKGFDLLIETLPKLLQNHDVRLAVVGSGDAKYEKFFRWPGRTPPRTRVVLRRIRRVAGALDRGRQRHVPHALAVRALRPQPDVRLRYGTIPIVRRTGGLADSVVHFDPATGAGTGIVFNDFDAAAMSWALDTAMQWYRGCRRRGSGWCRTPCARISPGRRRPTST